MTTNTLFKTMIDRYNDAAFTHHYIWGFAHKGIVYMAFTEADMIPFVCKLDAAGRGCGYSLRFCPKTEQKMLLMTKAEALCSVKYFNEVYSGCKYNRGEVKRDNKSKQQDTCPQVIARTGKPQKNRGKTRCKGP